MTLSKRALWVIFPVVLLSFIVAAFLTYLSLLETTRKLEQGRLQLAMTELAASYEQYSTQTESYLLTLIEGQAFRNYLSDSKRKAFAHTALSSALESTIRSFEQHPSKKLSLLISSNSPSLDQEYYFELSNDPFADPIPELIDLQHYMRQHKLNSFQNHIIDEYGQILITMSRMIDRRTLKAPIPAQRENSVIATFSLIPTRFNELREEIKATYGEDIHFHQTKVVHANKPKQINDDHAHNFSLSASINLNPYTTIDLHVPNNYLNDQLTFIKWVLVGICLLFCFICSGLLYLLLNRYITRPITNLQKELTSVIEQKKPNIELKTSPKNEIGRLERTFSKIYGDLMEAYKKTKTLSELDMLTQLHNVRYLTKYSSQVLVHAKTHSTLVAFIYLDMDNFKFVNDRFGHATGDALLRSFSLKLKRLKTMFEISHPDEVIEIVIGRIAGDEFGIIIEYQPPPENEINPPEHFAQQLLNIFKDGFHFEKGTFPVSASMGIASFPEDGHQLSQLLINADHAMYHAKTLGKNQIAYYSKEIATKARRIKSIEEELKNFNPDDECHLVYMPLVNSQTRKIEGFETLIRWISPKLGFVGPDEFIPIAEDMGAYEKIDLWVFETALKSYHQLREKVGHDIKLSINLSSAQLTNNKVSVDLILLAKKYQVEPDMIQLEMTETLNIEYTSNSNILLNVLVTQGFNIAIDDFGTGYTAMHQLIEYPASMIKLDKSFLDKSIEADNQKVLKALISLCHSQGMQVTAEGVETEEIAILLEEMGCDYLQGYFFGKPSEIESLEFQHPWFISTTH